MQYISKSKHSKLTYIDLECFVTNDNYIFIQLNPIATRNAPIFLYFLSRTNMSTMLLCTNSKQISEYLA